MSYIDAILFKLFLLWCRTFSIIKDSINILLDSNESFKWIVMEMVYRIKCVRYIMIGQRFESRDIPYINTYSINDKYNLVETSSSLRICISKSPTSSAFICDKGNCCHALEKCEGVNDDYMFEGFDEIFGNDLIKSLPTFGSRIDPEQVSPLIIIKCWNNELDEDMYLVRRGPFSTEKPFSNKKGPVKFLSIEYSHPEMIEPIELVFNSSWFIVGNELFTPSFVLRALEYQSKSYSFDEQYKIQIMDNNFDILNLAADTYIEITDEGYECYFDNSLVQEDEEEEDEHEDTQEAEEKELYKEIIEKKLV